MPRGLPRDFFTTQFPKVRPKNVNTRCFSACISEVYLTFFGLRPIRANPDGSAIWARNPDRVYELSNSFEF